MTALCGTVSADMDTEFYGYQWIRYGLTYEADIMKKNEFTVPRTYLRFSAEDKVAGYKGHITLDIAMVEGGQDDGNIDWAIWIKNAYVDLYKLFPAVNLKLRIGVQPVYFGTLDLWKYPLIEIPFEDKQGVFSSADLGAAIIGQAIDGSVEYEIAVYNGSGYKHLDTDLSKNFVASLKINFLEDYYFRTSFSDDGTDNVEAVILGFNFWRITGYAEYLRSVVKVPPEATPGKSWTKEGISLFLSGGITEALSLNIRYDSWNEDTGLTNDETARYIAGLYYELNEAMSVQFNYQLTQPKVADGTPNENLWLVQYGWSWGP